MSTHHSPQESFWTTARLYILTRSRKILFAMAIALITITGGTTYCIIKYRRKVWKYLVFSNTAWLDPIRSQALLAGRTRHWMSVGPRKWWEFINNWRTVRRLPFARSIPRPNVGSTTSAKSDQCSADNEAASGNESKFSWESLWCSGKTHLVTDGV